ncbi:MAG: aminotransferase class I/II-fold pyridoxal phosphate-dependent enzyme [Nevskiales bacterium]|nr:aminotransferase class I/II-fold pyridoxal phosphate-dependent enzyme [Nevskiales bacterium]
MDTFDPIEAMARARHEFGEHGGVNMSIEASTTFTVMHAEVMPEIFQGRRGPDSGGCYLYGRHFNPTVYALGHQLAAMEGAEAGYCTASGMGAIAAVVTQLCNHGDHVVVSDTIYGGSYALFHDYLPAKSGIRPDFVDVRDPAAVEQAFTADTRLLYIEAIANPTLKVADIRRLAEIAHRHGAQLVVDNTFSPLLLSPILLGADVIVHSLTKFISGASDIVGGAVLGRTAFVQQLMDLHMGSLMLLGPTMDPNQAFAISLRLPHLGLRMREHGRRALAFAERMHALGLPVIYPGLPDHPDHALLDAQRNPDYGYGGLLCIDLATRARAETFMELLQNRYGFGFMAVSLGYFETLMSCSGASTSSELSDADQHRAGISPGLVRMSVGLTGSLEQRWAQLCAALGDVGLPAG